jgi:3-mercaptopyruvate sulfurtransferase SseA
MSLQHSEFPSVVDADWLAGELGADDLVVGDVRGPNAHMRGHIAGSRPLVLGSPPPAADAAAVAELAKEVALRLRRHGITGAERLVLVDRGDGVGAMPAAQMAELAGHPRVAILLGGMAAWPGELVEGPVELERGNQCDPRQGHIPGAKRVEVGELFTAPGQPLAAEKIRELVGAPEGAEVVAYCHSGSRSALATLALRSAGYDARNYAGSWHEWSRYPELPLEH